MSTLERNPLDFSRTNLGEGLSPPAKADLLNGRIEIPGGRTTKDSDYYLSGRIPAGAQAPDLPKRQEIAVIIFDSLNKMVKPLPFLQRPPFAFLFASERLNAARVGAVTRIQLDGFAGSLSPDNESLLARSLKETIILSADQRRQTEMLNEGTELLKKAIKEKRNLLCLFALGGFFVCLLRPDEERNINPQERLLVRMPKHDIPALPRPTELASLYFLLRIKQLGGDRITAVPPAEWYAFINLQNSLILRPLKMKDRQVINPWQTERAWGIRIEPGSRTPQRVILMPTIEPKPGGSRERPHPRKPPRRTWR